MIYVLSFLGLEHRNGISTFCKNIKNIFFGDVQFISYYSGFVSKELAEINLGVPCNVFFKLLNLISGYRLSSYLLNNYLERIGVNSEDIILINAPSLLRMYKGNAKIIAVQHHSIQTLVKNGANFNNDKKFIKFFTDRVSQFIVLSSRDKDDAINLLGMPEHKISIIPHMSLVDLNVEPRNACKKRLVMLARLDNHQKRFDLVISAMTKLDDWHLNIYGDGPDKSFLIKYIDKLNLKNITIHQSTDDVISVLDDNDIHVMTSDFEGFGIVNIEAMRRRLPLIIRDTFPAASSLVSNNGILLPKIWSEHDFINAIYHINEFYSYFSENSYKNGMCFESSVISKLWRSMLNKI